MIYIHICLFSEPPVINPFRFRQYKQGDRVRVACGIITGEKPLTIRWEKDGHNISPYLGVRIQVGSSWTKITMSKEMNFHLKKLKKDTKLFINRIVLMNWGLKAFNKQTKCLYVYVYLQRSDPWESVLSINHADPKHEGNYTCYVSNAAASVKYTASLNIDGKLLVELKKKQWQWNYLKRKYWNSIPPYLLKILSSSYTQNIISTIFQWEKIKSIKKKTSVKIELTDV